MAVNANLKAQARSGRGKGTARKLRAAGRIPSVVYGHGEATRLLSVDAHELDLLFRRVHWENTLITLDIEGEGGAVKALVKEVQAHAYRPEVLHVDFFQVHAGEALVVEVPIRLLGTAPGVKLGGVLMHTINDLEVRCLPDNIPEIVTVDISSLDIGDSIHVRDLVLPAGVEVLMEGDRTVCSVTPPAVVPTEVVEEVEPTGPEPEVIRRAKEETEE